ncbi:MAG: DUF11 domain-containing protein [Clostridium sp.]|uniref:DUF11 domain-containing protein n=1 Tax=Clostridium sp. TaxID=1506 RepID=UPI003F370A88
MGTVNVTISPAIQDVYIVLEDKNLNTCQTLTTNGLGKCSFVSVLAGTYSLYNVGIPPDACPPTKCGYPPGYTGTIDPRRKDFSLTATGTSNQTFRYDTAIPWSTLNGNNPPTFSMTTSGGVNLATGGLVTIPAIVNNGMGYCMQDNFIYGSSGRSAVDGTDALSYPFTYTTNGLVGDCDENGYFYSPASGQSFTCIDVNSYSPTYLRACDPYNNYAETTSPFYVAYTGATFASADWSYVPSIQAIVGDNNSNYAELFVLSLTTPKSYYVPISGTNAQVTGITFADKRNFYQPTGSKILKYEMYTTIAYGTVLSNSTISYAGDGCRAVGAPVFYAEPDIVKKVDKIAASQGSTLIYTVTIVNTGVTDGITSMFMDTLPDGETFVTDSFTIDGVIKPGITPNSYSIGSLPIGKVFTVTFKANITSTTILRYDNGASIQTNYYDSATQSIFDTTFDSNIVTTTVIGNYVSNSKEVNRTVGKLGDILTYTIVTRNLGTTVANGVRIIDTIPGGTTFITGSLKSNGITIGSGTVLPPTGYLYGTLAVGQISTITFNVRIDSLPNGDTLINNGESYYVSPTPYGNVSFYIDTNTVATVVKYAEFGNIKKSVNSAYAKPGDILVYTIVLPNNGNTEAINVKFKDTIPNGTSLLSNTTFINGVLTTEDIQSGLNIGTIKAGEVFTITFSVQIN